MVAAMTDRRFSETPLPGFELTNFGPSPNADAGPRRALPVDHRRAHRARLRERFTEGGPDAVPDYELLEMILYRAFPRGDTKPLAKSLLRVFGDLNHVMALVIGCP